MSSDKFEIGSIASILSSAKKLKKNDKSNVSEGNDSAKVVKRAKRKLLGAKSGSFKIEDQFMPKKKQKKSISLSKRKKTSSPKLEKFQIINGSDDENSIDQNDQEENDQNDDGDIPKKSKSSGINKKLEKKVKNSQAIAAKRKRKKQEKKLKKKEAFLQMSDEAQAERTSRTLFIGNLPANFHLKTLKKQLEEYGKVKSIRIRCVAPAKINMSKKTAILSHQVNPNKKTVNVYVVFKQAESVQKAMTLNGTMFEEHCIQVDKIDSDHKLHDASVAVFLGNLSFKTTEDELREFFKDCGAIKNVRLVRDSQTGIGKGFGYINFETKDSVVLALEKNGEMFKNREIRVNSYKYSGSDKVEAGVDGKKNSPKKFNKKKSKLQKSTSLNININKSPQESMEKKKKFKKKSVDFKGEKSVKSKLAKKSLKSRLKASKLKKQKKNISEILSK